jgi:hypothetical protein
MAITPVLLDHALGAGGTSKLTNSVTPVAGRGHLAVCWNADSDLTAPTPTCTGAGLTWTQLITRALIVQGSLFQMRMTAFTGTGTPSAGAVTFDFAGDNQDSGAGYVILDFTGGTSFRQAVSAAATFGFSESISLTTLKDANSLAVGVIFHDIFEATSVGSGFTQIVDDGNALVGDLLSEYKANTTTVNSSWATNADYVALGIEVAAGVIFSVGMIGI